MICHLGFKAFDGFLCIGNEVWTPSREPCSASTWPQPPFAHRTLLSHWPSPKSLQGTHPSLPWRSPSRFLCCVCLFSEPLRCQRGAGGAGSASLGGAHRPEPSSYLCPSFTSCPSHIPATASGNHGELGLLVWSQRCWGRVVGRGDVGRGRTLAGRVHASDFGQQVGR